MENIVQLMRNANMNAIIEQLLRGFVSDNGCPEDVFDATEKLILQEWGRNSANVFVDSVKSMDGCYYFPIPEDEPVSRIIEKIRSCSLVCPKAG